MTRHPRILLLATSVMLAIPFFSGSVLATTLTFEEIGIGPPEIPDGYGGLNWDNWYRQFGEAGGYITGAVSGSNTAYNAGGSEAAISGPLFLFSSVYLTAAWRDGLAIRVEGFRSGMLVLDQTMVVDTSGPTLASFGLAVDELRFSASGGTNPGLIGDGTQIAMDDFTFVVVPEPCLTAPVALMTGALAFAHRRSRVTKRMQPTE